MLMIAFIFSVAFFAIPTNVSIKQSCENDYETYYQSYMDIMSTYNASAKAASVNSEEDSVVPRLIVNTHDKIDENGAVASCYYDGTYILQYQNCEMAEKAYTLYKNSDLEVFYDEKVSVEAVDAGMSSASYNSWGYTVSSDYLGVNSYINTLQAMIDSSSYNKVVVAVLDTGINTSHNMFQGRMLLSGYARNYVTSEGDANNVEDRNGHGTHVSGIIAEATPSSSVYILPLKVLDRNGEGYSSSIISAIKYATKMQRDGDLPSGYNLRLLNMSLGLETGSSNVLTEDITNAYNSGILSVVAAGNEKQNTSRCQPANIECAITVSALKVYSSFGSKYLMFDASYSNYGTQVDFSAPGTNITSAWIGSATATKAESGTSMATPHVTACAALLYMNPNITSGKTATKMMTDIVEVMQNNVDRAILWPSGTYAMGSATKNIYYGYGCVNIANCAARKVGKVVFGEVNRFQDYAFSLTLGYDQTSYVGTLKIMYTLTDGPLNNVYDSLHPISISKSTRITAIAYVYSGDNLLIQASEVTSQTYYVGDYDLESNYTIDTTGTIKYTGTELENLNVPSVINSRQVRYLGNSAFQGVVKNLTLPNTIVGIKDYAFSGNNSIERVSCSSESVDIGRYAFQKCYNLTEIDIPHIKTIGDSGFAYVGLTEISLPDITTIGKNAFSASELTVIYLGKNLESVGIHAQPFNLEAVYGYGTVASSFANTYNATFYDLTVSIEQDFGTQKVIKSSDPLSISLIVNGFELSGSNFYAVTTVPSTRYTKAYQKISENLHKITYTFSNLTSNTSYDFKVGVEDMYGNTTLSSNTRIVVVPTSAIRYVFDACAGNYSVFVDDWAIDLSTFRFYSGNTYCVKVVAENGYQITNVKIDDQTTVDNTLTNLLPTKDVKIALTSAAMESLKVSFNITHGEVVVDNEKVNEVFVSRGQDLSFTINGDMGYNIKRVIVNDEKIEATNGVYTIENVTTTQVVDIVMEETYYNFMSTYPKACATVVCSGLNEEGKAKHGGTVEITIVPDNGFKIDFVTVNGVVKKLTNGNTLEIKGITEDIEVVVSLKEAKASIFSSTNDSVVLQYFIVFGAIFVLFILGRIVLFIIRKNKAKS